jgi:uncharacterized membrane protein YfcA
MLAVVVFAAFAAGFVNALAGGGSFLTFPALIAAGLPPVDSNATSTVGLFPGQIATAFASRRSLVDASHDKRINVTALALISLIGGLVGGLLLLVTPQQIFSRIVPWLILFATIVFASGNLPGFSVTKVHLGQTGVLVAQALVSIYGGYFGGGIGILMLATLSFYGLRDIRVMNSLKILLAMLMNAGAVLTFSFTGLVHWWEALLVAVAALCGGFLGVHVSTRLKPTYFRAFVIATGIVLSIYFFIKPA